MSLSGYIEYYRKKYRFIPKDKTYINRNTPVGEPANFFEIKPYGGKKYFDPILEINESNIVNCFHKVFNYTLNRWEYKIPKGLYSFLNKNEINIPDACSFCHIVKTPC